MLVVSFTYTIQYYAKYQYDFLFVSHSFSLSHTQRWRCGFSDIWPHPACVVQAHQRLLVHLLNAKIFSLSWVGDGQVGWVNVSERFTSMKKTKTKPKKNTACSCGINIHQANFHYYVHLERKLNRWEARPPCQVSAAWSRKASLMTSHPCWRWPRVDVSQHSVWHSTPNCCLSYPGP